MSDVAVVILAGGEGRRIGGHKPLLKLGDERLIDRALRQARGWSDLVAIAVRDPLQVEHAHALLIHDERDAEGPLGGLIAALRFALASDRPYLLTIPTDMPFLPRDLLDRLARAIADDGCALASSGGHVHPVCGLWRAPALDYGPEYLAGGRRSLKGFAELVGHTAVEWPSEPDPFFNVNSGDDLAEARRRSGV